MDCILGQNRAIDELQAALRSGRLHHAWIFHGPVGVGKFTTALAYAQILLCHDHGTGTTSSVDLCQTCPSCNLFKKNNDGSASIHPDLHIITKELARYSDMRHIRERKLMNIPVEVLRTSLVEPVYRAAGLRHNKVFIIDEAELLVSTGQNLLLKTLEEPPKGTHLILVTSSEDRLLPTIRSRCQQVGFLPLPNKVIADWLGRQPKKLDEPAQHWLLQFAEGSLGRAKLAIEYDLFQWAEVVLPALDGMFNGRFDPDMGQQMSQRIDAFAKQWVDEHKNASKEAANKQAAALMWQIIGGEARQRLASLAASCDPSNLGASEAALQPWLGVIDALDLAQRNLDSNVNLGLTCDHLAMMINRTLSTATT